MKKDIYDMTIKELIEKGADIDVTFHNYGKESRKQAINDIKGLTDVIYKERELNGSRWIQAETTGMTLASFFEADDKDE